MLKQPCNSLSLSACVVATFALLACGDGSAPNPGEPSGEYQLQRVNGEGLPHLVVSYLDGSWDEIDQGSLRVLSRGRVIVMATMARRSPSGSLQRQTFDTVSFQYVRSGDRLILRFQDADGVRADTLDIVDFGENAGLLALSDNYRRPISPITLVRGALYVK